MSNSGGKAQMSYSGDSDQLSYSGDKDQMSYSRDKDKMSNSGDKDQTSNSGVKDQTSNNEDIHSETKDIIENSPMDDRTTCSENCAEVNGEKNGRKRKKGGATISRHEGRYIEESERDSLVEEGQDSNFDKGKIATATKIYNDERMVEDIQLELEDIENPDDWKKSAMPVPDAPPRLGMPVPDAPPRLRMPVSDAPPRLGMPVPDAPPRLGMPVPDAPPRLGMLVPDAPQRLRPSSSKPRQSQLRPTSSTASGHSSKPETLFHEKPVNLVTAQTILVQPELHFLRKEMEDKLVPERLQRSRMNSTAFSEDELSLVRRFPWLAERLKLAWAEVKDGDEALTKSKQETKKSGSLLKHRQKEEQTSLKQDTKEEKKSKPKVVFSRNIPLFIYSNETKKAIRVGGDHSRNDITEEVYKALEYNPELKKITLDLQDICRPDRDRTIRLAVSYLSATTNHNPLVISEHMARYSGKKEAAIKYLINEIERRLLLQRKTRDRRNELWKRQLEQIILAKLEAERRENDIMVAKRLLVESKHEDTSIMTVFERQQERTRRIKLRTKSIPVSERMLPSKKERRMGVHHISLYPPDLPSLLSGPVLH